MSHKISLRHQENMQFEALIDGHSVRLDTSPENGGNNSGPSPKKLMLASLAGCTAVDIVMILTKQKVAFSDLSIDVQAELTDENPKIYRDVKVIYSIRIGSADYEKMHRAVALSSEKYCGVMAMFRAFATVTTEINFL